MKPITLTTDFGESDWFVGSMKGVIAKINPRATVIDITHGIPPGDIRSGAFALMAAYRYFSRHAIHVAVIDPGVGSDRLAMAVKTDRYLFIAPDNGVLSWALRGERVRGIRRLENTKLFLPEVSNTFHGRDIFAPVAAHLSRGLLFSSVGPIQKEMIKLAWPQVRSGNNQLEGEVLYIDRFGNAISNISQADLNQLKQLTILTIDVNAHSIAGIKNCYQSSKAGDAMALISSSGFLEIAINGGSAAAQFNLRPGTRIIVRGT